MCGHSSPEMGRCVKVCSCTQGKRVGDCSAVHDDTPAATSSRMQHAAASCMLCDPSTCVRTGQPQPRLVADVPPACTRRAKNELRLLQSLSQSCGCTHGLYMPSQVADQDALVAALEQRGDVLWQPIRRLKHQRSRADRVAEVRDPAGAAARWRGVCRAPVTRICKGGPTLLVRLGALLSLMRNSCRDL